METSVPLTNPMGCGVAFVGTGESLPKESLSPIGWFRETPFVVLALIRVLFVGLQNNGDEDVW